MIRKPFALVFVYVCQENYNTCKEGRQYYPSTKDKMDCIIRYNTGYMLEYLVEILKMIMISTLDTIVEALYTCINRCEMPVKS